MNSDQLPTPYVWEPDPAFDYMPTPPSPKSQEDLEHFDHPQPTKTDKNVTTKEEDKDGTSPS